MINKTSDVDKKVENNRLFSYCIDYGDVNGLGHLPEFADQKSGRQILVNGPTSSDRR